MSITRDHLGRDRLNHQTKFVGHIGFHFRRHIGEGSDRAGNRASGNFVLRHRQPLFGPLKFGIVASQFQAKGGGLGVDSMASADCGRQLVFKSAAL